MSKDLLYTEIKKSLKSYFLNLKSSFGFTLIELLVVILIIFSVGILIVSILFSALRGANKTNTIDLVRRNGNSAITQMSKMIRYSQSFDGVSIDGSTYTTCDGRPIVAVPVPSSIAKLPESGLQSFWANIIQGSVNLGKKEVSGLFSKLAVLIPKFGGGGSLLAQVAVAQASLSDLIITDFHLTDAAGATKISFAPGEAIYPWVTIKNQGTAATTSPTGYFYTSIYSNSPLVVGVGTSSDINVWAKETGSIAAGASKTYSSTINFLNWTNDPGTPSNTSNWSKAAVGSYTARAYVDSFGHVAESDGGTNNQTTSAYSVSVPPTYTISGNVFIDDGSCTSPGVGCGTANNGAQDGAEPLYLGSTPVNRSGTSSGSTNTSGGTYSFSSLSTGTYNISLTVPAGYLISPGTVNPRNNIALPPTALVHFGIILAPTSTPTLTPTPTITPAPTTITRDATVSTGGTGASATSITILHTVGAGTNRILIVSLAAPASITTGIKYGGISLTKLGTAINTKGGHDSSIWYLKNPDDGTANVIISFSIPVIGNAAVSSWSGVDVDQTPFGTTATAEGNTGINVAGTATVNVTSAPGEIVIDSTMLATDVTAAVGPGQTQLANFASVGSNADRILHSSEAGASTVTMSWNYNGHPTWGSIWRTLAVPLKPVSTHTISGDVYYDNGAGGGTANNGSRDGTEPYYGGATVNRTGTGTTNLVSTATSPSYSFTGLTAGNYTLSITSGLPAGWIVTSGKESQIINVGPSNGTANFPLVPAPPTSTPTTAPPTSTPTTAPPTSTPTTAPPTPTPIRYHYAKVTGFDGGQTVFKCLDSTLNPPGGLIASNSASLIDTGSVDVSSCYFTCSQDNIFSPPNIGIKFSLTQKGNPQFFENRDKADFQTSVSVRNY